MSCISPEIKIYERLQDETEIHYKDKRTTQETAQNEIQIRNTHTNEQTNQIKNLNKENNN